MPFFRSFAGRLRALRGGLLDRRLVRRGPEPLEAVEALEEVHVEAPPDVPRHAPVLRREAGDADVRP